MMEIRKALAVACLIGIGLRLYGVDFIKTFGVSLITFLLFGGWRGGSWRLLKICQLIPRDLKYVYANSSHHVYHHIWVIFLVTTSNERAHYSGFQ